MGNALCADEKSSCHSPVLPPWCCGDLVCEFHSQSGLAEPDYICWPPRAESEVGVHHQSRLEKAVQSACVDQDVQLVALAAAKGFPGATGCKEAAGYCSKTEVADLCPSTCAIESGCGQVQEALFAQSIVENQLDMTQIGVFALAFFGGVSIIAKAFSKCTRNHEYKEISEDKKESEAI